MSKVSTILSTIFVIYLSLDCCAGGPTDPISDAVLARQLVHQANKAAVGSISTNEKITDYPMVNVIKVDDSALNGSSTGHIHFLLSNFDFTGADSMRNNKVTFFFSDEESNSCDKSGVNSVEPICPRIIISGRVKKLDTKSPEYNDYLEAFNNRHKNAKILIQEYSFYLNELEIENIFFVAFKNGPRNIAAEDYYNAQL